ncbi:UNVERIFIED_CONTAM: hypothetical protein K2H54_075073 [Gekko kuhli]
MCLASAQPEGRACTRPSGKTREEKEYWLGLPMGWSLHSWVSTPVPITSHFVQKEASCVGGPAPPSGRTSTEVECAERRLHSLHTTFSVFHFSSSPGKTERLLTRLLKLFQGSLVAQQEVRRRRMCRTTRALHLLLGTVYTDIIFALCHFW